MALVSQQEVNIRDCCRWESVLNLRWKRGSMEKGVFKRRTAFTWRVIESTDPSKFTCLDNRDSLASTLS